MNKEVLKEMLAMLKKATESRRLSWREQNSDTYIAQVSGCDIVLQSLYDFNVSDSYCTLTLYNIEGIQFATYTFYETANREDYAIMHDLFNRIYDIHYKVAESENLIMQGLKDICDF